MRSLVGIITTIATVIHFTFGCCLHPCHTGGRGDCVAVGTSVEACEDCCHAHLDPESDEHARAAGEPEGGLCGGDGTNLVAASDCDACHGCHGCHCAATSTETGMTLPWQQAAAVLVPASGAAIVPFADARGRQPPDPHVHPCAARNPLFERFLI